MVIKVPQGILPSFNLLDRYLSRIYLRVFGVTFLGMLAVFYIAIFTDYSEYLFKGKTTGQMLLSFFLYSTPQYIYYITAMAALVGTLVTVGLLTRTSELTVMQACGVSLYRATVPMLLFGMAWSVVLFGMEQSILAASNRRAEELKSTIRTGMPRSYNLASRQWMAGSNGELYHYGRFDSRAQRLEDLTVYTFGSRGWNVTGRTYARVTTHMDAHTWRADLGWQRTFGDRNAVTAFSVFPTRTVTMETPDYFGVEEPEAVLAERLKVGQLREHIAELEQAGLQHRAAAGGAAPQDGVPVHHADHDPDRHPVWRHHGPQGHTLRHRDRDRPRHPLLDDAEPVCRGRQRRSAGATARGMGAEHPLRGGRRVPRGQRADVDRNTDAGRSTADRWSLLDVGRPTIVSDCLRQPWPTSLDCRVP